MEDLTKHGKEVELSNLRYSALKDILTESIKLVPFSLTSISGLSHRLIIDLLKNDLIPLQLMKQSIKGLHPNSLLEIANINPKVLSYIPKKYINKYSDIIAECSICCEFNTLFKLVKCRHKLCLSCRDKLISNESIKCPFCRTISRVRG